MSIVPLLSADREDSQADSGSCWISWIGSFRLCLLHWRRRSPFQSESLLCGLDAKFHHVADQQCESNLKPMSCSQDKALRSRSFLRSCIWSNSSEINQTRKALKKPHQSGAFLIGGGGEIWTPDLRVMSPTSYQTALPRVVDKAYIFMRLKRLLCLC